MDTKFIFDFQREGIYWRLLVVQMMEELRNEMGGSEGNKSVAAAGSHCCSFSWRDPECFRTGQVCVCGGGGPWQNYGRIMAIRVYQEFEIMKLM